MSEFCIVVLKGAVLMDLSHASRHMFVQNMQNMQNSINSCSSMFNKIALFISQAQVYQLEFRYQRLN